MISTLIHLILAFPNLVVAYVQELRYPVMQDLTNEALQMNISRMINMFAGLFIMLSLVLAHVFKQIDLTQVSFLWFAAFVGFNLFQSSLTGFCPLGKILKAVKE